MLMCNVGMISTSMYHLIVGCHGNIMLLCHTLTLQHHIQHVIVAMRDKNRKPRNGCVRRQGQSKVQVGPTHPLVKDKSSLHSSTTRLLSIHLICISKLYTIIHLSYTPHLRLCSENEVCHTILYVQFTSSPSQEHDVLGF